MVRILLKVDRVNYVIDKILDQYDKLFDELNDNGQKRNVKEYERKINELVSIL